MLLLTENSLNMSGVLKKQYGCKKKKVLLVINLNFYQFGFNLNFNRYVFYFC